MLPAIDDRAECTVAPVLILARATLGKIESDVVAVDIHVADADRTAIKVTILENVEYGIGESDVDDKAAHFGGLAPGRLAIVHRAEVLVQIRRRGVGRRRHHLVTHRRSRGSLLAVWTEEHRRVRTCPTARVTPSNVNRVHT